jgi:hypothetical protein
MEWGCNNPHFYLNSNWIKKKIKNITIKFAR